MALAQPLLGPAVRLVLIALAALALVGCSGGGDDTTYSRSATRACLESQGFEITDDRPDYSLVGIEPSRGAISTEKEGDGIELAFGADSDEAKDMEKTVKSAGEAFAGAFTAEGDTEDFVFSKGNVTYWWVAEETSNRDEVEGCLTSGN